MGLDTLVEAAHILRRRTTNFQVIIGGDGPLRKKLDEQIRGLELQNQVHLIGKVPESSLPAVFRSADCFILPTRSLECFGLIALESFASNTPVIGSNVAAIPELVSLQGDGWLYDNGNAAALAGKMVDFLEGRLRSHLGLRELGANFDSRTMQLLWESKLVLS
jgi:glycosyltransferase involved in cell wall biosynthesis